MQLIAATVGVPWFPEEYTEMFYIAKALIGMTATAMVVFHMSIAWRHIIDNGTIGQRLRYYCLLACAFIIAGGSVEQYNDHVVVGYRNLAGFLLALLIIVAMSISIREDIRRSRRVDKS